MATNQVQQPDDLSLVSGLYGPGNVLCWYFTLASCLVSWTLDRIKRRSDTISADLVVCFTLPVVALAHLINQVKRYPGDPKDMMTTNDPTLLPSIYGIEAPFTIIENFMTISVLLVLLAFFMSCFKRAITIALVGLMCYFTEWYAHVRVLASSQKTTNFHRSFVADFRNILLVTAVLLVVCTFFAFYLTVFLIQRANIANLEDGTLGLRSRDYVLSRWHTNFFVSVLFVAMALFGFSEGPCLYDLYRMLPPYAPEQTPLTLHNVLDLFFPRTSSSISDLDQVVTALGGATVLGYSLYGIVSSWYKEFTEEQKAQEQMLAWIRMQSTNIRARASGATLLSNP